MTKTEGASSPTTGQPAGQPTGPKPEGNQSTEPARETDWKAEARKWEQRAKANAEAAKKLAEIEESQKTEAEKVAERLAKAEAAAKEAEAKALRREAALEYGLSKDDAALLDAVTDEDAMRRLAERLAQERADRERRESNAGAYVPSEGRTTPALKSDALEQALRQALGVA